MTTNLSEILAREMGKGQLAATYLWKTDTQLSGPLAHLPIYSDHLGSIDWRKGPMKGAFHDGPAIEPLRQI